MTLHRATKNALLILLLLMVGDASAQSISPGQLFPGDFLNIHAPKSDGWRLVGSSSGGMAFGRRGEASGESYIAQVSVFPFPETKDREEFIAAAKEGIEKDTSPDRFRVLQTPVFEYTEARGYPCVKYKGRFADTQAKTSLLGSQSLMLQVVSLYCRHPKRKGAGFMAGISHRAKNLDDASEAQADAFIEGVQVPDK